MTDVQAAPNTHPGGVHGALFNEIYHSEVAPLFISMFPNTRAPKFSSKNIINVKENFIYESSLSISSKTI